MQFNGPGLRKEQKMVPSFHIENVEIIITSEINMQLILL